MKTPVRYLLLMISTALLFFCAERAVDPYGDNTKDELQFKGTVSGIVTNDAGEAVVGASITLTPGGFSTNSDSLGRYTVPNVSADTYAVAFHHAFHFDTTLDKTIRLVQDQEIIAINVTMRRNPLHFPGSITGLVTNGSGQAVAGTLVRVDDSGSSSVTDSLGNYTVIGVPAGIHRLTFSDDRFIDTSLAGVVVVMGQKTAGVSMVMRIDPEAFKGSVSGRVYATDSTLVPLPTVTIPVNGKTTIGDSAGVYTITGVVAGTYAVQFHHDHYYDTTIAGVTLNIGQSLLNVNAWLRKKPEFFTGTIRGIVVDSQFHQGMKGVTVSTTTGGFFAITTDSGAYEILNVPFGQYDLTTVGAHRSNTITNIVVKEKQTTTVDTLFAVNTDTRLVNFTGLITGRTSIIKQVIFRVTGDSIKSLDSLVKTLVFTPAGQYSTQVYLPQNGTQWSATVRVYDSLGHMTGWQSTPFAKSASIVEIPSFDVENAKPRSLAKPDTTLTVSDTLRLRGAAIDSFDTSGKRTSPASPVITKWEWSVGGGVFKAGARDTTITLPSAVNTGYRCILRVTDNDGNTALDTAIIEVKNTAPYAGAITLGYPASPATALSFNLAARDSFGGTVRQCRFDFDSNGVWDTTLVFSTPLPTITISCTRVFGAKYGTPATVVAEITDDDGNRVSRSLRIFERLYVNIANSAATVKNGLTWATAYPSLHTALDTARKYGFRDIWVAKGNYGSNYTIKDSVRVYGGFAGTETALTGRARTGVEPWSFSNLTELDGSTNVDFRNVELRNGARLDGFTIRNGVITSAFFSPTKNRGAGASVDSGAVLSNCIVRNCKTQYIGGGIWCGSGIVENCLVEKCRVGQGMFGSAGGGGIYLVDGIVRNCLVRSDTSEVSGGGIFVAGKNGPVVFGCLLYDNIAGFGDEGRWSGGGVFVDTSTVNSRLVNLSVVRNTADTLGGGIHYFFTPESGNIMANCALFDNVAANANSSFVNLAYVITESPDFNGLKVYRSAVAQYTMDTRYFGASEQVIPSNEIGNAKAASVFVAPAPASNNFHPKTSGSPSLINKGTATYVPRWAALDLDGEDRTQGLSIDLGAYESQ